MRLLFVTQDFPPDVGGIQTYAAELAPRLAARTEFFALVTPRRPDDERVDSDLAFPVYRLRARPDLLVFTAASTLPGLAKRHSIDVAFHAQWQTVPASLLARRLTGHPRRVVVAAHGRELLFNPFDATPLRAPYDRARNRTLRATDRFVAVSRFTAGLVQQSGVDPARIDVVPNGTDPEFFHPVDATAIRRKLGLEDRRVLLTVARLVPRKGIDTVLAALGRVIQEVPEAVYLVVGEGPDRGRLERMVHELGLGDHVRFTGSVPYAELPRYYSACDLFVMPARSEPPDVEGFGFVFIEASACGKPVIGAYSGGIPDAVQAGQTGLLVPPNDADELARAILKLITDPELARRMGEQGRGYVLERANWDRVALDTWATIQRALIGNT